MTNHVPERRKTPRIPVSARVTFKEGGREEVWFTEDLSLGGLFLKVDRPPFIGTVLDLEIALSGVAELVKARGEIVWRHEGRGCGLRFTRLTAQNKKLIETFLNPKPAV
ncbi:MAG: PilZ domain-containing protein [Pseudomonadota bacterium]